MKYYLIGEVVDTKKSTISGIETILQKRLDNWLGKDKTQIKVDALNSNTMKFTLYRKYGNWYEDPQRFQPQTSVFSWDEHILLGERRGRTTAQKLSSFHNSLFSTGLSLRLSCCSLKRSSNLKNRDNRL